VDIIVAFFPYRENLLDPPFAYFGAPCVQSPSVVFFGFPRDIVLVGTPSLPLANPLGKNFHPIDFCVSTANSISLLYLNVSYLLFFLSKMSCTWYDFHPDDADVSPPHLNPY
jgi:hypothetical protein